MLSAPEAGRSRGPVVLRRARRYNEPHSVFLAQFLAIPSESGCESVRLTALHCSSLRCKYLILLALRADSESLHTWNGIENPRVGGSIPPQATRSRRLGALAGSGAFSRWRRLSLHGASPDAMCHPQAGRSAASAASMGWTAARCAPPRCGPRSNPNSAHNCQNHPPQLI